jgi:flagellin
MSVVINTNASAAIAADNLAYSNQQLQDSLNRLSSGSKIVNPSDDAGGMAVAAKLTATAGRDGELQNNVHDALSYAQTQDGALQVAGSILNRISELETLYQDPTKNTSDLANYDSEFSQLQAEFSSLGNETFNGVSLFGNGDLTVATTDDLGTAGAVSVAEQGLGGQSTLMSDDFASLANWTVTGTTFASGGNFGLSGSDVMSTGTTKQSFSGSLQISFDLSVPGTGDSFDVSLGGQDLVNFSGAGNISRSTVHRVQIDLSSSGVASTYLDGSSSAMSVRSGISLAGGAVSFSADGAGPSLVSQFSVSTPNATALVTAATSLGGLDISTITDAIQDVATMRAQNGAEQSRLNFASSLLTTNQTNLQSAISAISDVDVAQETTNLAKWNVLVQSGTSMLTQANQSAQIALKLITG